MAYKYEYFDHISGRIRRGDYVVVNAPNKQNIRELTSGVVIGINKNTIKVKYLSNAVEYEATFPPRYIHVIHHSDESIVNTETFNVLCDQSDLYSALMAAGVDNWEGYKTALEDI